ncbi:zinc ribbon domain-containing protein [Streptococcus xiaochunlingii]|uniref:zinc-ribbon domain-containing protein n=1 Tax=Streptococcus TaxID=1301 RepID=UPI0006607AC4|nr:MULTISPECIES: zinc ribbon domain-containing protein [Streptococcus]MDK8385825.1 zinc ribbon domain-containing protein [Streptococcus xiaochunlingii]MDK8778423.1 zinc ribbon domain-containing protein [Streptococcus xiaochunlingii]
MKNCTNCQAPINAGDAFCSKCGAKVQVAAKAEPKAVAFQPKTVQLGPSPTQAPEPKKPKRNIRGILAGIFVLLAVIAVASYFLLNRGSSDTINLEDYVKLEIKGNDGEGFIVEKSVSLNKENLDRDIKKKLKADHSKTESSNYNIDQLVSKVEFSVYKGDELIDVKERKNLNNHDKITVKLLYDKSDLENMIPGLHFTGTSVTQEADLIPLVGVDPFKGFYPKIKGISPNGTLSKPSQFEGKDVEIVAKATAKYGFPFDYYLNGKEVSSNDPIAVGDEIEIRLNESGKNALKENGQTVEKGKDSMKYKVTLADFEEGAYVTSLSKVDEDTQEAISKNVEDAAKAYVADRNYKVLPKFEGMAFAAIKDGVDWGGTFDSKIPQLIYVYSITNTSYGKTKTSYIVISKITVIEQVENHGKDNAHENPGKTIQTFEKDSKKYNFQNFSDQNDLKNSFTRNIDTFTYTMDDQLKSLINWTE